jgi:hypothetical protein
MRYTAIYSNMQAEHPEAFPAKPTLTGQGRGGGAGAPQNVPPAGR